MKIHLLLATVCICLAGAGVFAQRRGGHDDGRQITIAAERNLGKGSKLAVEWSKDDFLAVPIETKFYIRAASASGDSLGASAWYECVADGKECPHVHAS